jgi:UPF0755 protein
VLFARVTGSERTLKAGPYALRQRSSWTAALGALTRGEVLTQRLTIPEGFRLAQIAPRVAELSNAPIEWVDALLATPGLDAALGVPGPGLEGYLFPDTYYFAFGVGARTQFEAMVARYKNVWTPARRARLDSLGMTEAQIVTLASIVQAEARLAEEMPRIAGVYHNRLRLGMLLQADPTVLYALGGVRRRVLYRDLEVDSPYNTYLNLGLPPGPICNPGLTAIEAALDPLPDTEELYFVAAQDGSGRHLFSRTYREHVNAKRRADLSARDRIPPQDSAPPPP